MSVKRDGNIKWIDGLRGLASLTVVITHVARAFDTDLFNPAASENGAIRFLQWPFIRVFIQGRIGVAIFSMVTGYVCALKPIRLIRQGNAEGAFGSLSKSAIRRVPRLFLPTTIATLLIWLAVQFNAFAVAEHSGSEWVSRTSPETLPTIWQSLGDLWVNIIKTWTENYNRYDQNQWTLMPLLKGSMLVYAFLTVTARVRPAYRMLGAMTMWWYYYMDNDAPFGMQFFWGVFLAEFQHLSFANNVLTARPITCCVISVLCMVAGLAVASLPEYNTEWTAWSNNLRILLDFVLYYGADYSRFSTTLGLHLISISIHFSPFLQSMLSNKYFLWLGKQSFAVYLLHGPILRTVLCWMLFGFSIPADHVNDEGETVSTNFEPVSGLRLLICFLIWFPLNYAAAIAWTNYIDPWCEKVTAKLVAYVKEDTGGLLRVELRPKALDPRAKEREGS